MDELRKAINILSDAFSKFGVAAQKMADAISELFSLGYTKESTPPKDYPRKKYKRVYKCKLTRPRFDIKPKKHLPYQRRNY